MGDRKAKVTPETQEEARKLRALWDAKPARMSQARFGEEYQIGNQSAVAQFLAGKTPLSMNAARGFAVYLGCSIEDFSPRLAAEAAGIATAMPASDLSREVIDLVRALQSIEDPEARAKVLKLCHGLVDLQLKHHPSNGDVHQPKRKQA